MYTYSVSIIKIGKRNQAQQIMKQADHETLLYTQTKSRVEVAPEVELLQYI